MIDDLDNFEDKLEKMEEALWRIKQWSEAYPLDIFLEPDLKKARALLEAGGMTLDSISAHCMRHVVEGVGKIAREALEFVLRPEGSNYKMADNEQCDRIKKLEAALRFYANEENWTLFGPLDSFINGDKVYDVARAALKEDTARKLK